MMAASAERHTPLFRSGPCQREDRKQIVAGLSWLNSEALRRFSRAFAALDCEQRTAICDDVCYLPKTRPRLAEAARFFARYRDLTAGGFNRVRRAPKILVTWVTSRAQLSMAHRSKFSRRSDWRKSLDHGSC